MEKKKFEFSKIISILTYTILIFSLSLLLFIIILRLFTSNENITDEIISNIALYVVTPAFALVGVTNSFYYIKSKAENLIRLKVYNIATMIDIQDKNPNYMIYSSQNAREDFDEINQSIDNSIDSMIDNTMAEDPSSPT